MDRLIQHSYNDINIVCKFEGIEIKMHTFRDNNKNTIRYTVYGGESKEGTITGSPATFILDEFKKTEFHNEAKEAMITLANLMEKYK